MKFNRHYKSTWLIYLIVSCFYYSMVSPIRTVIRRRQEVSQGDKKAVATCMKALMDVVPPQFCLNGIIPKGCPEGFVRFLALCYRLCKKDYKLILGFCWKGCKEGYKDHGLTCYKNLFKWYFKGAYKPKTITNFDPAVPCPKGLKKVGALCNAHCKDIDMVGCGPSACALSSSHCMSSIQKIIAEVFKGIVDLTVFILSFGSKTTLDLAKKTVIKGIEKVGSSSVNNAYESVKIVMKDAKVKEKLLNQARLILTNVEVGELKGEALIGFCNQIWDNAAADLDKNKKPETSTMSKAIGIFNVGKDIVVSCMKIKTKNEGIACAAKILQTLKEFDPTGLLTIASAFMHPQCAYFDQITSMQTLHEEEIVLAAQVVETVPKGCVVLYENCYFTGNKKEICSDSPTLPDFNSTASSLAAGEESSGMLFEDPDYGGKKMSFAPYTTIPCLKDVTDVNLDKHVSSVKLKTMPCVVLSYVMENEKEKNFILCETKNITINIPEGKDVNAQMFENDIKITLYSDEKQKGTSWVIDKSDYWEKEKIPFKTIKSVKYG